MKKAIALSAALFVAVSIVTPPVAFAHTTSNSPTPAFFGLLGAFNNFGNFFFNGDDDKDDGHAVSFRSFISSDSSADLGVGSLVEDIVAEVTRPFALLGGSTLRVFVHPIIPAASQAVAIRVEHDDDGNGDDDDNIGFPLATSTEPCIIPPNPFEDTPPFIHKDGKVKIISTGKTFIFKDGKHKIIATPGSYIEKNGKEKIIITPGVRVYKNGSLKEIIRCNGIATTTPPAPDTVPPVIVSINASTTSATGAKIMWTTDEKATATLFLSTSTPLSTSSAQSHSRMSFKTSHSFVLSALSASTTYYYSVSSTDRSGNTATSSEHSFTTGSVPVPDVTPPVITALSLNVGSTTAALAWTTSEAASGKVFYGTSTPLALGTALSVGTSTLSTSHAITLQGLATSTTYFAVVESKDASGNAAVGSEVSFTTGF